MASPCTPWKDSGICTSTASCILAEHQHLSHSNCHQVRTRCEHIEAVPELRLANCWCPACAQQQPEAWHRRRQHRAFLEAHRTR